MRIIPGKKTAYLFYTVIVLFAVWLCGLSYFGYIINSYTSDNTERTDAIVVLTGGKNRINEAIKLLNDNLADRLFISGVRKNVTLADIEENTSSHINDFNRIELGYKATNTIGNASEIKEWIDKNSIGSIRLMTSHYHIPRALAELSAYNLRLKIIVHPVFSGRIAEHWWQSWATFKFMAAEYNKLLFVYLRNLFR